MIVPHGSVEQRGLWKHERSNRPYRLRERADYDPWSIQPHGLLLALRGTDLTVVRASANSPLFVCIAPREMLGQPVGRWFDEASGQALAVASRWEDPGQANPLPLCGRGSPDQRFDGILHRSGADLILELERVHLDAVVPSVRGALPKLTV